MRISDWSSDVCSSDLLAIAERREEDQRKVNPDLRRVLFAPARDELLDWLRTQPLVHVDRDLAWMMIHAGLAPKWTTPMAEQHAREVESRLRNGSYPNLFKQKMGRAPGRDRFVKEVSVAGGGVELKK